MTLTSGCARWVHLKDAIILKSEGYNDAFVKTFNKQKNNDKAIRPPVLFFGYNDRINDFQYIFPCEFSNANISKTEKSNLKKKWINLEGYLPNPYSYDPTVLYFDIYDIQTFGDLLKNQNTTYSDVNKDADKYIKLKRVLVKAPLTQRTYNRNNNYTFELLQKTLYAEVLKYGGDGAIDLCGYWADYKEGSTNSFYNYNPVSGSSTSGTTKTYWANAVMTATIIKFTNGFFPDGKFLITKSNIDLDKQVDFLKIPPRINSTILTAALKNKKTTVTNCIGMDFQYVSQGQCSGTIGLIKISMSLFPNWLFYY